MSSGGNGFWESEVPGNQHSFAGKKKRHESNWTLRTRTLPTVTKKRIPNGPLFHISKHFQSFLWGGRSGVGRTVERVSTRKVQNIHRPIPIRDWSLFPLLPAVPGVHPLKKLLHSKGHWSGRNITSRYLISSCLSCRFHKTGNKTGA